MTIHFLEEMQMDQVMVAQLISQLWGRPSISSYMENIQVIEFTSGRFVFEELW